MVTLDNPAAAARAVEAIRKACPGCWSRPAVGTPIDAVHQIIEQIRDSGYADLDKPVEAERKPRQPGNTT